MSITLNEKPGKGDQVDASGTEEDHRSDCEQERVSEEISEVIQLISDVFLHLM